MAIRSSGAYHSPEMAAVAQNIAQMFGPPSGSELAAYSTARVNNQKAGIVAQLAQNPEYQGFDHQAILADLYDPTQSFQKVQMDDVTTRRGQDVSAATSRANNLLDNQRALALPMIAPRDPTHSAVGITPTIAEHFGMPEVPGFVGEPAPLSETQWKATQLQELKDSGGHTTEELLGLVGGDSASQEKIARLTQQFIDTGLTTDPAEARNLAIGITDGRYKDARDPVTGAVQIVDVATGRPAYEPSAADSPIGDPVMDLITPPGTPADFGPQYPAAAESFGVGGALAGGINTALDAVGVGAPYKDIQQSQADFGVLRESLLNDISDAYSRQPPSWLLQEIRSLTPAAGSPFEGAGGAVSKLNAIGRHLTNELQIARQALERDLSPANQQEAEAKLSGLEAGIVRVQTALDAFGSQEGGQPGSGGTPPEGVDAADWQYLTEEERALFQ